MGACVDICGGDLTRNDDGDCACSEGVESPSGSGTCYVAPDITCPDGETYDDDIGDCVTDVEEPECPISGQTYELGTDSCSCPANTEVFGNACVDICGGDLTRNDDGDCGCSVGVESPSGSGTCYVEPERILQEARSIVESL